MPDSIHSMVAVAWQRVLDKGMQMAERKKVPADRSDRRLSDYIWLDSKSQPYLKRDGDGERLISVDDAGERPKKGAPETGKVSKKGE